VFTDWWNRFNDRLNQYLLADFRNSLFDGYTWAMMGVCMAGFIFIYLL
jgi:hypothetical protein